MELWNTTKKFFSNQAFKTGFAWFLFFSGLTMTICGYCCDLDKNDCWYLLLTKLGEIILISTLFSFLTTTTQFLALFKKMIEDIIYTPGFIKNRADIEAIWERTSNALFKSKFPLISHEFLETIKKSYIPIKEISYYNNYRIIIEIDWDDEERKWIRLRDTTSFELHPVDNKEFKFESSSWTRVNSSDSDSCEEVTKIIKCKIDGEDVLPERTCNEIKNGEQKEVFSVKLKGKNVYNIFQIVEKKICLDCDNFTAFRAKWLVNNMTVQLFHPKDMNVNFVSRGTSEDFKFVNKRADFLQYEYKGLILRHQGYVIILTKKM